MSSAGRGSGWRDAVGVAVVLLAMGAAPAATQPLAGKPPSVLTAVVGPRQGTWTRSFNPFRSDAESRWPTWAGIYEPLLITNRTTGAFTPWLAQQDPQFRELFALQVAHCWAHDAFLGERGILDGIATIAHLPAVLIHGRLDVSGPLITAWELHQRWPGSRLVVIENEGHGGKDLSAAVSRAYAGMPGLDLP